MIEAGYSADALVPGVSLDIAAIAPDYEAVRLTVVDRDWFQRSHATQITAWFTTVHILPNPVRTEDIRARVELHRRFSAGSTGRN